VKRSGTKVDSTALLGRRWTLEWREHGRWVKSAGTFTSPEKAKEQAEMIGAFGMIRILPNNNNNVNPLVHPLVRCGLLKLGVAATVRIAPK